MIYLSVAYILVVVSTTDAVVAALVGYIGVNWAKEWIEGIAPKTPDLSQVDFSGMFKGLKDAVSNRQDPAGADPTVDDLQKQLKAAKDALTTSVDVDITGDVQEQVNTALQEHSLKTAQAWQELYYDVVNPDLGKTRFTEKTGEDFLAKIRDAFRSGEPVDPAAILANQKRLQNENSRRLDFQSRQAPINRSGPAPFLGLADAATGRGESNRTDLMTGQSIWIPTPEPTPTASTSTSTSTRRGTTSDWASIIRGHQIG